MSNPSTIVLLVAHGSRNPRAAEEHKRLCELVAQALDQTTASVQVRPAYLELTEPSMATAIDDAVRAGATTIRVLPHFLNSGNHVLIDLPAIVEAAREAHPNIDIRLETHLGADPGLIELTARRIAP